MMMLMIERLAAASTVRTWEMYGRDQHAVIMTGGDSEKGEMDVREHRHRAVRYRPEEVDWETFV